MNVSYELENSMQSDKESSSSMKEVQQLRQEAEVFAGQVIELDAEMENLRAAVEARDKQIIELQQELQTVRRRRLVRLLLLGTTSRLGFWIWKRKSTSYKKPTRHKAMRSDYFGGKQEKPSRFPTMDKILWDFQLLLGH